MRGFDSPASGTRGARPRAAAIAGLAAMIIAGAAATGCAADSGTDKAVGRQSAAAEPPLHPMAAELKLRRLGTEEIRGALSGKTLSSASYPSGMRSPGSTETFTSYGIYVHNVSGMPYTGRYTVYRSILCIFSDRPTPPMCRRLYAGTGGALFFERLDMGSSELFRITFE